MTRIESELRREMAAVTESCGCRLLDVEDHGSMLRLVLDRPEGVTLEDCETVSRQVSALLDVTDFGASRYVLEVTSPGLDRKLYDAADYSRFAGHRIQVTWKGPAMPHKRTVVGVLEEFRPDDDTLAVVDSSTGERHEILLSDLELARLAPEF